MPFEQPRMWRMLERHPLSAEYKNIPAPQRKKMAEDMKQFGFDKQRPIVMGPDEGDKMKIVDGWQRQLAAIEAEVKPTYCPLPRGVSAEDYIRIHNDNRRHESADERSERVEARRERVAKGRGEGKSMRTIAEEENVPVSTVAADVKIVEESAPETNGKQEPAKTTGKDGKTYTQTNPKKPKFVENRFEEAYGKLIRVIDARAGIMGKGSPPLNGVQRKREQDELKEKLSKVMQSTNRLDRCQELMGALLDEYLLWKVE